MEEFTFFLHVFFLFILWAELVELQCRFLYVVLGGSILRIVYNFAVSINICGRGSVRRSLCVCVLRPVSEDAELRSCSASAPGTLQP